MTTGAVGVQVTATYREWAAILMDALKQRATHSGYTPSTTENTRHLHPQTVH